MQGTTGPEAVEILRQPDCNPADEDKNFAIEEFIIYLRRPVSLKHFEPAVGPVYLAADNPFSGIKHVEFKRIIAI